MSIGHYGATLNSGVTPPPGFFIFDNYSAPTMITLANTDNQSMVLFPATTVFPSSTSFVRSLVLLFFSLTNTLSMTCWINLDSETLSSDGTATTYVVNSIIMNRGITFNEGDRYAILLQFQRENIVNIQTFTSSGTYTPTVNMDYCSVELVGGGGSGGSCATSTATMSAGAGGGGGGAYVKKTFSVATVGTSQTVTVGTDGTTTSFGSLLSAVGGTAGVSANPLATWQKVSGGTGGVASGGIVNINGGQGGDGWSNGVSASCGGMGGSTVLGIGGPGAGLAGAGFNPSGYGAGGGGSASNIGLDGTATSGGSGGNGIVIITEYIT